ncbi:MAG: AraC family transcriptional regulator [Betaproteobacteria bacterium]
MLASRTLQHTDATVTEVRSEQPTHERSDPLPPVDASGVAIQLRDFPVHEWWEDNRRAPVTALRAGQITLYDVRRDPRFRINNPFHSIHIALPRTLMESVARECSNRPLVDLQYAPGKGLDDPVLQPLLLSSRPALARPEEASRLFVEHVTRAVATHVAVVYGHVREKRPHSGGGLSPWQRRRAIDLIDANLDGTVTIAELARCCGLSDSYFSSAFKHSVGVTPHRWLIQRRVEKARDLLRTMCSRVMSTREEGRG